MITPRFESRQQIVAALAALRAGGDSEECIMVPSVVFQDEEAVVRLDQYLRECSVRSTQRPNHLRFTHMHFQRGAFEPPVPAARLAPLLNYMTNNRLEKLDLFCIRLTGDTELLAHALRQQRRLKWFQCLACTFGNTNNAGVIADALATLTSLEFVLFQPGDERMPDPTLLGTYTTLSTMSWLHLLELRQLPFSVFNAFFDNLQILPGPKKLDIVGGGISPSTIQHVAQMLAHNSHIQDLTMYTRTQSGTPLKPIASALTGNTSLRVLNIRHTTLSDDDVDAFVALLETPHFSLERIDHYGTVVHKDAQARQKTVAQVNKLRFLLQLNEHYQRRRLYYPSLDDDAEWMECFVSVLEEHHVNYDWTWEEELDRSDEDDNKPCPVRIARDVTTDPDILLCSVIFYYLSRNPSVLLRAVV
ncbi:expressed unknown protein [Seminavis robusta]|uniref:Uncharacterized protein n=1 Tax=Seminavis robusta TaxID=568900 RepID=A0A9N8EKF7_9STRA|nr:expressed unknown protein [Seminavis robusta]|eukprot:Sro1108_g242180.1 n/a (417) ;mRNA; f:15413-16663